MRSAVYIVLMVALALVAASATVEVYRACGEGWWWKGKDWCAIKYLETRLQPPPLPAEPAEAPPPEPKPKPKSKAKAKG